MSLTIFVPDGVLLEHILHRPALDMDNIPDDGLAAGYWVAFVNGDDYDNIKYSYTDREGYLVLPYLAFEAPAGKTLSYDIGNVGDKVRITTPLTVIQTKWIDESKPDSSSPDSSKPESSNNDSVSRPDNSSSDSSSPDKKNSILGDVNGDGAIDIEDAVAIIQHINGVTPLTADEESRADVSKDKNIDIDDAVTLISYINGNSTF